MKTQRCKLIEKHKSTSVICGAIINSNNVYYSDVTKAIYRPGVSGAAIQRMSRLIE